VLRYIAEKGYKDLIAFVRELGVQIFD